VKLIISLYDEANLLRRLEYEQCLAENLRIFSEVHVLYEKTTGVTAQHLFTERIGKRCAVHTIDERPTFERLFQLANSFPAGSNICIANADILFDQTIIWAQSYLDEGIFLALSRRDSVSKKAVHSALIKTQEGLPNFMSADAWLFRSPLREFKSDYLIGELGCDSYINYWASKAGYRVFNPCLDVNIQHVHDDAFFGSEEKLSSLREGYLKRQKEEKERNEGIVPQCGFEWTHLNDITVDGISGSPFFWSPHKIFVVIRSVKENSTENRDLLRAISSLVKNTLTQQVPIWLVSSDHEEPGKTVFDQQLTRHNNREDPVWCSYLTLSEILKRFDVGTTIGRVQLLRELQTASDTRILGYEIVNDAAMRRVLNTPQSNILINLNLP